MTCGGALWRAGKSKRGTELLRAGENNIILKAITMNSPQFRHESTPLSLTRGKKEKDKKSEGRGKKQHPEMHTDE